MARSRSTSKKTIKRQASNLKPAAQQDYSVPIGGKVYHVKANNAIEAGVKAKYQQRKESKS